LIAFSTTNGHDFDWGIATVRPNGTGLRQLTHNPRDSRCIDSGPQWMLNGARLLFNRTVYTESGWRDTIVRLALDSGRQDTILDRPGVNMIGGHFMALWPALDYPPGISAPMPRRLAQSPAGGP